MNRIVVFIYLYLGCLLSNGQLIGKFPREFSSPQGGNDRKVKVKDIRPTSCDMYFPYYPVFIEDFDYKGELPNRFRFDFGDTKDSRFVEPGVPCTDQTTWFGEAFNNNINISNGICNIEIKEELVLNVNPKTHDNSPCQSTRDYNWTSAALNSMSKFTYGAFVARIALPYNIYTWPALWLYGEGNNKIEIDIFEYYDKEVNNDNCNVFLTHQMASKNWKDTRSDKYPVKTSDFGQGNFRIYELAWTPYRIDIWVDNKHVGHANRYFSKNGTSWFTCKWDSQGEDPSNQYNCDMLFKLGGNKEIKEDLSWPTTQYGPLGFYFNNHITAGNVVGNNSINQIYQYSNYSNLNSQIDYFKIFQPVNCFANTYICSTGDLLSQTQGTNFASGLSLYFGGTNSNCGTLLEAPKASNGWSPPPPLHCFAANEIGFEQDFGVEEGQYMEASIINPPCGNNGFDGRAIGDSIWNYQSVLSLMNEGETTDNIESNILSEDNFLINEVLSVYPNPVIDDLNICLKDGIEVNFEILTVEVLDLTGRIIGVYNLRGQGIKIDFSKESSGLYLIRTKLSNESVIHIKVSK